MAIAMIFGGGILSVFASNSIDLGSPNQASFTVPGTIRYLEEVPVYRGTAHTLRITAPDNTVTNRTGVSAGFLFDQIGVFTFEFLDSNGVVLHRAPVVVEMDGEWELRVYHGGTHIPTVTALGRTFMVPEAHVYHRGEDDFEFVRQDGTDGTANIPVEIFRTNAGGGALTNITAFAGREANHAEAFRFSDATGGIGRYTIVYQARLPGSVEGRAHFTESFDIRVQSASFEDTVAPRLTVTGVSTTASLNTRLTLPSAVATDDYDTNTRVMVTVTHEGVNVPQALVDRSTGFAVAPRMNANDPVEAVFDNGRNMVFYPLTTGIFRVTYQAIDDFGNESPITGFNILVEDRTAPVLVDFPEEEIPSNWGITVNQRNPAGFEANGDRILEEPAGIARNTNITIPFPEFVDNGGRLVTADGETTFENNVYRVSFEIRDTVNNQTVVRINDILEEDARYTFNADQLANGRLNPNLDTNSVPDWVRAEYIPFTRENGFTFNFGSYIATERARLGAGETFDGLGRYIVQFQARDPQHNITTRTFDIQLDQHFEDVMPPVVAIANTRPMHVHQGMRSVNVPSVTIIDSQASRINREIRLTTGGIDQATGTRDTSIVINNTNSIAVESGESLIVRHNANNIQLLNRSYRMYQDNPRYSLDQSINLNDLLAERTLTIAPEARYVMLYVTATDYVGNTTQENNYQIIRLVTDQSETLANNTTLDINVGNTTSTTAAGTYTFSGLSAVPVRDEATGLVALGGFAITGVPNAYRNFVGFELSLVNTDNDRAVAINSLESFFINGDTQVPSSDTGSIVVNNMQATLRRTGVYQLTIRAFDVNGASVARTLTLTMDDAPVGGGNNDDPIWSSAPTNIPDRGAVNQTFILRNEAGLTAPADANRATPFMVRVIENATHFSLMGSEFTAHTTGAFRFNEGFFVADSYEVNAVSFVNNTFYTFNATDAAQIQIDIQGAMPLHAQQDTTAITDHAEANWVHLPVVTAHNGNQAATVRVEVTDPNNQTVHLGDNPNVALLMRYTDANGRTSYRFRPRVNGTYRIRFTASVANSSAHSEVFYIRVGDTTPLAFRVDALAANAWALNDTFTFAAMRPIETTGANLQDQFVAQGTHTADELRDVQFIKRLVRPDGSYWQIAERGVDASTREYDVANEGGVQLTTPGLYRIEFITRDANNNEYIIIQEFTITGGGPRTPLPLRVISTILIIVGVLLTAIVFLYFMRFSKKKIKA